MRMLFFALILFLLSCGDLMEYEQKVYGNYYLIGNEVGEVSLRYKVQDGGFILRVPPPIIQYAVSDSLIIVKRSDSVNTYYVINASLGEQYTYKNSDSLAIEIFSEKEYNNLENRVSQTFAFKNVKE